jgi:hypothetical protein
MTGFDFFTIGHSNIPAERFTALLRGVGVRRSPTSGQFQHRAFARGFRRKTLRRC